MAIAPRSAPNSSMTAEIRVGDCGTLAVASFDFVSTNLRKDVTNIIYGKSVKRAETRRYEQKSFIPSKFAIEEKRWTGRQSLFPLSKIPWFFLLSSSTTRPGAISEFLYSQTSINYVSSALH